MCKCGNDCNETNSGPCYLIQNFQSQLNLTPSSLQNLHYGVYPNNNNYNNVRLNYNKLLNYFPQALFYPNNENDISYLIHQFFIRQSKFAIRCGGHSYEGASLSNQYVLDVSNLEKKIMVSSSKPKVRLSSGLLLGDVIKELSKQSLITPLGSAECVGLSGLVLAGGVGLLSRMYGLSCQNIVSVNMVNYKGELMHIDKHHYPDLFWAIKGAGCGNFGVITEIGMKTYNDIFMKSETLTWKWNKKNAFRIYKLYQKEILQYPNNMTANFLMNYNNGTSYFSINFYVFGTDDLQISNIFKQFGNPTITSYSGYYSKCFDKWGDIEKGMDGCFSKIKSSMIFKPIDNIAIQNLVNSVDKMCKLHLNVNYQLNFLQFGGEIMHKKSSFYSKNAIMCLSYFATWSDNNLTKFMLQYMKHIYSMNEKYLSIYCFPNFIDYDISNYMKRYYGKYEKMLIKIKKKYDPHNLFKFRQSIPIL